MSIQQYFYAVIFLIVIIAVVDKTLNSSHHLLKFPCYSLAAIRNNPCNIAWRASILLTQFVTSVAPNLLMSTFEKLNIVVKSIVVESVLVLPVTIIILFNFCQYVSENLQRNTGLSHVSPIKTIQTVRTVDPFLRRTLTSLFVLHVIT